MGHLNNKSTSLQVFKEFSLLVCSLHCTRTASPSVCTILEECRIFKQADNVTISASNYESRKQTTKDWNCF